MKTYIGTYLEGSYSIVVARSDSSTYGLKRKGNHSPTGFSVGYGGSGPAETAFSILVDFFDDGLHLCKRCDGSGAVETEDEEVRKDRCSWCEGTGIKPPISYQDFKFGVIANLPQGEDFVLTGQDIETWIAAHRSSHEPRDDDD